jgi:hypothetical protein
MSLLPGGIGEGPRRERGFAFHALTGELEMNIEERLRATVPAPVKLTGVLREALAQLGGAAPDEAAVAALSVGDRAFLLRELLLLFGHRDHWQSVVCPACARPFDVHVPLAELPVREATTDFPVVKVQTSRGARRFRTPTGADQAALADVADDGEALRRLLARCEVPEGAGEPPTPEDVALIDASMAASFPQVVQRAGTACPECGATAEVDIDLLRILANARMDVVDDVFVLASALGWSEKQILKLPRWRRLRYVSLAERARGAIGRAPGAS